MLGNREEIGATGYLRRRDGTWPQGVVTADNSGQFLFQPKLAALPPRRHPVQQRKERRPVMRPLDGVGPVGDHLVDCDDGARDQARL